MAEPIKLSISGPGIVATAVQGMARQLVNITGIADGTTALAATVYIAGATPPTVNNSTLAALPSDAEQVDTLACAAGTTVSHNLMPNGIPLSEDGYIVVQFTDTGVNHEVFVEVQ